MSDNKKSFILYADLIKIVEQLPDEVAGKLFKIILHYVNEKEICVEDLLLKVAFEPIRQQLLRNSEKWDVIKEKRSLAGKKSAEIKKENQQTSTKSTHVESVEQTSTKSTVNDNVNVTVNGNVNDNVINGLGKGNPPSKKNLLQKAIKQKKSDHLFSESEYFEEAKFVAQFLGTDYEACDLLYYRQRMLSWAESKSVRRKDWIAQARTFMLGDASENKLRLKNQNNHAKNNGTTASNNQPWRI